MEKGIESRADVGLLVSEFYSKVRKDELLGPVFAHVNWEHHTPLIVNFWSSILLGDQSYQGNPFKKHINLPIRPQHFERWLQLFKETINENFKGEVAQEAMNRADTIAKMFQFRLGLIE
jgi:hemoglobin